MKHREYWRQKALERVARMEAHLQAYHDSIFDIPSYVEIFWYVLLWLVLPCKKCLTKDEKTT